MVERREQEFQKTKQKCKECQQKRINDRIDNPTQSQNIRNNSFKKLKGSNPSASASGGPNSKGLPILRLDEKKILLILRLVKKKILSKQRSERNKISKKWNRSAKNVSKIRLTNFELLPRRQSESVEVGQIQLIREANQRPRSDLQLGNYTGKMIMEQINQGLSW